MMLERTSNASNDSRCQITFGRTPSILSSETTTSWCSDCMKSATSRAYPRSGAPPSPATTVCNLRTCGLARLAIALESSPPDSHEPISSRWMHLFTASSRQRRRSAACCSGDAYDASRTPSVKNASRRVPSKLDPGGNSSTPSVSPNNALTSDAKHRSPSPVRP